MTLALDGKSALITGGYGGFGKACAIELARDGALVTLMGRKAEQLERARDIVLAAVPSARIALHAGDAADEADVESAVSAAVDHGEGLDIVVATVGGTATFGPIEQHSYASFLEDLRFNAGTAFLVARKSVPVMTNGGSMVFISSTAAQMAMPDIMGYCAGKAALDQFVRSAANGLGTKGIRLNCVRPGLTHTDNADAAFQDEAYIGRFLPKIPLGRTGMPIDIAAMIRFLAGPESSWITGQSITIDGGQELRGPDS